MSETPPSSGDSAPPPLAIGDVREQLPALETEVLALEEKVRQFQVVKTENATYKSRMNNLRRALFQLLHYRTHMTGPEAAELQEAVRAADMALLPRKTPTPPPST